MHRVSVAPMMAWTDAWYRVLLRLIDRDVELWTEMLPAAAVWRNPAKARMVVWDANTVAQLGGQDPDDLFRAAQILTQAGYKEINLNMGCPSPRVASGGFGAQMMLSPSHAKECLVAIGEGVSRAVASGGALSAAETATQRPGCPPFSQGVPPSSPAAMPVVSAKIRIGVDHHDDPQWLQGVVDHLLDAGVGHLAVHARKALLNGISPRANRKIPQLNHARVEGLAQWVRQRQVAASNVQLTLNGGIDTAEKAVHGLTWADKVMIGRAVTRSPMMLASLGTPHWNADQHYQSAMHIIAQFKCLALDALASKQTTDTTDPAARATIAADMAATTEAAAEAITTTDEKPATGRSAAPMRRDVPFWRTVQRLGTLFTGLPDAKRWRVHFASISTPSELARL